MKLNNISPGEAWKDNHVDWEAAENHAGEASTLNSFLKRMVGICHPKKNDATLTDTEKTKLNHDAIDHSDQPMPPFV